MRDGHLLFKSTLGCGAERRSAQVILSVQFDMLHLGFHARLCTMRTPTLHLPHTSTSIVIAESSPSKDNRLLKLNRNSIESSSSGQIDEIHMRCSPHTVHAMQSQSGISTLTKEN